MSGSNTDRGDSYTATPTATRPSGGGGSGGGSGGGGAGGGSGGGGSGGDGGDDRCNIVETVPLNSPQPPVIATLSEGDVLDINLDTSGPRPVLEVLASGRRAGALTHRNHVRIINCINEGRTYRAVVVRKRGGDVEIRVEPA